MSDELAIVIVTHDSAAELELLLESVERCLQPRPQVVVVDNDSRDDSARVADEAGAEVIRLGHNVGFGAANNAGMERVGAPLCALLNPDIELLDSGLLELAAQARHRRALLVPRLLNSNGTPQRSAHPVPGRAGAVAAAVLPPALLPRRMRLQAEPWRAAEPREVGWAIAAALLAQTPLLRALGPFDAQSFMFFEDLELCLRARAAGIPTVLDPRVAVRHSGQHSTARAYSSEPHELQARRRRAVIHTQLGPRALAWDDGTQALTFASRAAARALLGRDNRREREQLRALRAVR